MVIVFFGTPQFAVPSLEQLIGSRHQVRGVVTQPDRARGRGQRVSDPPVKAAALRHGIPVIQPERLRSPEVADALAAWNADLGVVVAYGKLIPESLLQMAPHGMINVHASLLPKYRGAAPVHRAVIAGESETGVTIMRVAKALDSGNMLAAARRPIGPDETSDAIERDLAELGARLLITVVDEIESGTWHAEPQDELKATYAPRLTKDEGLVDWMLPARDIHNRVRGLYPWPHAYAYLGGARVILLRTRVLDGGHDAQPGEVVAVTGDAIQVAAGGGGVLAIEQLQAEGRRPMTARDFLAGRPVAAGTRFTRSPAE
jgi:methionyl-tRNA formyltransferase